MDSSDLRNLIEGERKARLRLQKDPFPVSLSLSRLSQRNLYEIFFHGPAFQVLGEMKDYNRFVLQVTLAHGKDLAACRPLLAPDGVSFALEAALHGAGLMCLLKVMQRNYFLPRGAETILLDLAALRAGPPAVVTAEFLCSFFEDVGAASLLQARFNVFLSDSEGRPIGAILGLTMVGGADEPPDKRTLVTRGIPFRIGTGLSAISSSEGADSEPLLVGGFPFIGVSVADVSPLLGHQEELEKLLSPPEIGRLREFSFEKRRAEWLAGRLALKLLLNDLSMESSRASFPFEGVTIVSEQTSPTLVIGSGVERKVAGFLQALHLSIAHSGGLAVATASPRPIGIDVEPIEPLASGVPDKFLSVREKTIVSPENWLALWTAKEAVTKTLGVGFGIQDFTKIEVGCFGYNEPYIAKIAESGKTFSCLSFKDSSHLVTLAWESN